MAKHTFIISDENVINSYGFRVMTDGIRLGQYNKNPIVLWMHKRSTQWTSLNDSDKEILPIGLASNLRKENGQLLADVEFDKKDTFAKKIEEKVERGIIRMASPGLEPIALSDDTRFLLPGQKRMTLTESSLEEISIVDIGSNPNALKLYNSNKEIIELSAGSNDNFIPLLKDTETNSEINIHNQRRNMEFQKQVAIMLGKEPDASLDSVMAALKARFQLASEAEGLKVKLSSLEAEIQGIKDANIIALVDANVDKKITADKRDMFIKLGKDSGIEPLRGVLDTLPGLTSPSGVINFSNNPGKNEGQEIKTFADLKALGTVELSKFRKEKPSEYTKLFKLEYGYVPNLDE